MNFKSITKQAMPAVGVTAGVIAAKKVADLIPVGNDLTRNGIVVLAGLFLSGKKGIIGNVGLGMAASGIHSLAATYVPGIAGFDRPVFINGTPTASSSNDSGSEQGPGYQY